MIQIRQLLLLVIAVALLSVNATAQLLPSGGSATNITQVGGTNITLGQKAMTSSFPVVIASDQSTLAVSLSGNQATNVAQINGVTPLMGNGVTGTGSLRVTVASDNTTIPVTAAQGGAPWSQNVTQLGGNSIAVGNGVTGTGSQRVTIASDNTIFSVNTVPKTSCGNTVVSVAWVAVPTVNAAPSGLTATTCLNSMIFTNTNATAQTVTITDGQGSPITLVATYSIPGNSTAIFPMYATAATTGIKWVAGGTGVTGAVTGWQ